MGRLAAHVDRARPADLGGAGRADAQAGVPLWLADRHRRQRGRVLVDGRSPRTLRAHALDRVAADHGPAGRLPGARVRAVLVGGAAVPPADEAAAGRGRAALDGRDRGRDAADVSLLPRDLAGVRPDRDPDRGHHRAAGRDGADGRAERRPLRCLAAARSRAPRRRPRSGRGRGADRPGSRVRRVAPAPGRRAPRRRAQGHGPGSSRRTSASSRSGIRTNSRGCWRHTRASRPSWRARAPS